MRKIQLAAVVMTAVVALTMVDASAASSGAPSGVHVAPAPGMVTVVDYRSNGHSYHHRAKKNGHWRYWN